jgi:putative ABC transport system substrate-binding protein
VKRREFITLLGGLAGSPLAAHAQHSKLPTIGYLGANTPSAGPHWVAAFVQRLGELGWIEGRNLAIEYRWAEDRSERFAEIAAEFVRLKVDVILAHGTQAAIAAKQATAVTPIVATPISDPLSTGLVANLARPGTNVTGLSMQNIEIATKRIELLQRGPTQSPPTGDLGQCQQSRQRAGDRRGSGSRALARPRIRQLRNSAS